MILAFINNKGGVAKTTSVVSTGAEDYEAFAHELLKRARKDGLM